MVETLENAWKHMLRPVQPFLVSAHTAPSAHVYLAGDGGVGEIAQKIQEPTLAPTNLAS